MADKLDPNETVTFDEFLYGDVVVHVAVLYHGVGGDAEIIVPLGGKFSIIKTQHY